LVEDSAELQLEEQELPTVCTEEQGMILLQTWLHTRRHRTYLGTKDLTHRRDLAYIPQIQIQELEKELVVRSSLTSLLV